eukprot:TRINITY_DN10310_c0_g1_i2.p1 TRINITY_DN10310_c0_g1~~TRINITY_DN10310_c0_g1_i2.p1  ORF type:complete len:371 (-),score=66.77 TRINITY_DN10310_c0_g1_i2:190-1302(-)
MDCFKRRCRTRANNSLPFLQVLVVGVAIASLLVWFKTDEITSLLFGQLAGAAPGQDSQAATSSPANLSLPAVMPSLPPLPPGAPSTRPDVSGSAVSAAVDAWYVNVDSAKERVHCMEGQLKDLGFHSVRRYSAAVFPGQCKSVKDTDCLVRNGWGDCLAAGVNSHALEAHLSKDFKTKDVSKHVFSNWCSHMRLFEATASDPAAAPYHLVLEDDVTLSSELPRYLTLFVEQYRKPWDSLQLDPFGSRKGQPKVWQADGFVSRVWARPRGFGFWGWHGVLVKRTAMARLVACMRRLKVMPVDWVHLYCNSKNESQHVEWLSVLVAPNVVQQPEMFKPGLQKHEKYRKNQPNEGKLPQPTFCSNQVYESMIR